VQWRFDLNNRPAAARATELSRASPEASGLVVVDGRLKLSTECSLNLFKQSTIEGFFERFLGELRELARALESTLVS